MLIRAEAGVLHIGRVTSRGEHLWEGYHIQNVNAYTSRLKTRMSLSWHRMNEREGKNPLALPLHRCSHGSWLRDNAV